MFSIPANVYTVEKYSLINQSINQSVSQSALFSIHANVYTAEKYSLINQPINQSMNQSVNRSICRVQYPSGVDDWQTGQEGPAALWPRSDGGGGRGGQTDDGPGGAAGPHLGWGAARAGSGHPRELLRHGRVSGWLFCQVSYTHIQTGLCVWFTGFLVVDIHESIFDMGGWVAGCSIKYHTQTLQTGLSVTVIYCDFVVLELLTLPCRRSCRGCPLFYQVSYTNLQTGGTVIYCDLVVLIIGVDIHESFFDTGEWVTGCSNIHKRYRQEACDCDLLWFGSAPVRAEVLHLLEVDIHDSFFNIGWCFLFAVSLKGWHWSLAYLSPPQPHPPPPYTLSLSFIDFFCFLFRW